MLNVSKTDEMNKREKTYQPPTTSSLLPTRRRSHHLVCETQPILLGQEESQDATPPNQRGELLEKMIEDARGLWVGYGGREIRRIEEEMRAAGWKFYRQMLYNKCVDGVVTKGWPDRFGWHDLLTKEQRERLTAKRTRDRRCVFERWLADVSPELTWSWKYQRHVYKRLVQITSGGCKRLMIFMPPRHGKSEMVTVRYTAWRLLSDPKLNVILGSYNQKLADKFSRRIRRVMEN